MSRGPQLFVLTFSEPLFNGNQMQLSFRYKLKGKPDKNGFQRIEVEGIDSGTTHILNPLGDGYYIKK